MKAMTVSVSLKAKDNISPVIQRVNSKLDGFEAKTKQIRTSSAKMAAVSIAGITALGASIGGLVGKYQDLAKSRGEIKSLGLSGKEIDVITKEAKAFSNAFSGTTQADFVRASYDIKSGISSLSATGVAKFTALAALTGKATKSTTEQMTSFFATGYGIYNKQFEKFAAKNIAGWHHLSKEERDIKFGEYFAAGIAGAVKEFKTNGAQMQAAIENLGAAATSSNVPLSEQLAILGTLQKSMSGSDAATKYRAFLTGIVGAQKKLKLHFLDSNNQLKSTPEILEEFRRKFGDALDDMEKQSLKKALGSDEAMAYVTALYDKIDDLRASQGRLNRTMKSGTKEVLSMAQAMNEGREFELLSQNINNLAITIGEQFAPMAVSAAKYIGYLTTTIDKWMGANSETVDTIVSVVSAGGMALATVAALSIGVSALTFAVSPLVKVLRGAVWLFGGMSKKGTVAAQAVRAVSKEMDTVAGKSVSAYLGVKTPKKASLIKRFSSLLGNIAKFVRANPIMIAATVTAAGLGAMASAQHTQIMYNRPAKSTESAEQLKARIAHYESRIKAMKGEGSWVGRSKEFLLNGVADQHKISQQEKLLAIAQKRLAQKEGLKTVVKPVAAQKVWTKSELEAAREKAFKIRDQLKISKKVEQKVHIEAPVHITVNAVNGAVPTQKISDAVKHGVKNAVANSGAASYEDQE